MARLLATSVSGAGRLLATTDAPIDIDVIVTAQTSVLNLTVTSATVTIILGVTVLDAAVAAIDNNTNPMVPSAGTDRYWLIVVLLESQWTNIPSTITVAGDTATTLDLISSINTATMDGALYGVNDAGIGTNPSTANGSLTYNVDGDTPGSFAIAAISVVAQGVDQTTPYTDTVDIGWSVDATDATQNCPFTLNEITGGLGVAFVSCSKTVGVTWDLTDNGYAGNGLGPFDSGTDSSFNAATKEIAVDSIGQLTTFTTTLAGDKTGTFGIMLLPPSVDTVPDPFSFTDLIDQVQATLVTSNIITVTGIAAAANISIAGPAEFSINGGIYSAVATTVNNNDTVQLRVTTGANGGQKTDSTLTIDSENSIWNVETAIIGLLDTTVNNYSAPAAVQNFGHALTNTSGACYKEDSAQVAVIRNGAGIVYLYALGNYTTIEQTITLSFDALSDSEDICDMGNGEFAICSEDAGTYSIHIFDWPVGTTVTSKQNLTIAAAGIDNNSGAEGVCYDRVNEVFYVVGEGEQASTDRKFFRVVRPTNTTTDYTYTDPELTVTEPFVAETAFNSLGIDGAAWDLSGIDFDHTTGDVVISSHTGQEVAQVNVVTGAIVATLVVADPFQLELVAILPSGELMLGGEPFEYQIFEADINVAVVGSISTLNLSVTNALVATDTDTTVVASTSTLTLTTTNAVVSVIIDPSITSNTDPLVLSGNSLVVADFNSDINTVSFNSGTAVTTGLNLAGTGNSYTWDIPDVTTYVGNTQGSPYTSANHPITVEAGDGTDTDTLPVVYNPPAGWAVVETLGAVKAIGYVAENFDAAPADQSQYLYPTANSTTVDATGLLDTSAVLNFGMFVWDVSDDNWKPFDVIVEPDIDVVVTAGSSVLNLVVTNSQIVTDVDVEVTAGSSVLNLSVQAAGVVTDIETDVTATPVSLNLVTSNADVVVDSDVEVIASVSTLNLSVTGTQVSIDADTEVVAGASALNLTVQAASVVIDQDTEVVANNATLDLVVTNAQVTTDVGVEVNATTSTLNLQSQNPTVLVEKDVEVVASSASLNLTVGTAEVNVATEVDASSATLNITKQDAIVEIDLDVDVMAKEFSLNLSVQNAAIVTDIGVEVNAQSSVLNLQVSNATVVTDTDLEVLASSFSLDLSVSSATIVTVSDVEVIAVPLSLNLSVTNALIQSYVEVYVPNPMGSFYVQISNPEMNVFLGSE